jgi:hypothetical protein
MCIVYHLSSVDFAQIKANKDLNLTRVLWTLMFTQWIIYLLFLYVYIYTQYCVSMRNVSNISLI